MSNTDKEKLLAEVNEALNEIRPHLIVDGGNIEVVDITDDLTVKVKWVGNCINCSMSAMTMKAGVEQAIKSKIPTIKKVEAINGIPV